MITWQSINNIGHASSRTMYGVDSTFMYFAAQCVMTGANDLIFCLTFGVTSENCRNGMCRKLGRCVMSGASDLISAPQSRPCLPSSKKLSTITTSTTLVVSSYHPADPARETGI